MPAMIKNNPANRMMLVLMLITKLITSKSTPNTIKVIPKEGSTCSDFLSLLFFINIKLNVKYSYFDFHSLKKKNKS